MAEEYSKSLLRVALAQICQHVGFHGISSTAFDVLLDLFREHLENLCENTRIYSDHCGRTNPILDDVGLSFTQLGISLDELSDYLGQTAPINFPRKVPKFPVRRPNKLNIPSSDCAELKSRPDYIPRYLPPMQPEKKEEQNSAVSENAKANSVRVGSRRSTLQQKSEQLNGDDWWSDLYDFDAVKAGLVKIVHVQTPLPSAQPSPQPSHHPTIPKITIVEMAPTESSSQMPPIKQTFTIHKTISSHSKQPKLHLSSNSGEKLTISKSVLKDVNASSSSTSDHSADTSIEEVICSVVEQTHHLKVDEHFQQISPMKHSSQTDEIIKAPKQITPIVEMQLKPTKSLPLKPASVVHQDVITQKPAAKTSLDISGFHIKPAAMSADEPKVPVLVVNQPIVTLCEKPPVLKPVLPTNEEDQVNILKNTLKFTRQIINKDIIKKRLKKRAEEKEAKRRKIDDVVKQLTPVAAAKRAPPPMPVVDTSTLFQPDAKIISTITKKVTPLVIQKPKVEQIVVAPIAPSSSLSETVLKQNQSSPASRPKTPTKKLGPLRIKLPIPPMSIAKSSVKKVHEKAHKKEKIKEKKFKEKHQASKKSEKVSDLLKKLPKKTHQPTAQPVATLPAESFSSADISDKLKVPKLTIKLGPKPDQEKFAEESKKLPSQPSGRAVFTISPDPSSPERENAKSSWTKDDEDDDVKDLSVNGMNLSDLRSSPPPKSPSMHSKSPSLRSFSDGNANSPPPPTPSPRSPSPDSPIRIFIPDADAQVFGKTLESPVIKLVSPAQSQVSTASTVKFIQETPEQDGGEKIWYCPVCHVPYEEGADMIACDKCDNWFHWSCVGLSQAPPDDEPWYCTNCASKKQPKINKLIVKKKSKKGGK